MEPFIGMIVMFGGNFAPRSWALCDGQLLPIAQNQALFSILGTIYGGDGRTTFALPDLRGRVAMHPGSGPGLTTRSLGQKSGSETVTLNVNQIPSHRHNVQCDPDPGTKRVPTNAYPAGEATGVTALYSPEGTGTMHTSMIAPTGGGQSHTIVQPFQCVNFIIALQGTFPSRN